MFEPGEPKTWISIIFGLIIGALGLIPLLNKFNVISFSIPEIPRLIMYGILTFGGVYVIIDGFLDFGMYEGIAIVFMLIGAGITVLGIVLFLVNFGVLSFDISFFTSVFINAVFVLIGIILLIAPFLF